MKTIKFVVWATVCTASGIALKVSPKTIQQSVGVAILRYLDELLDEYKTASQEEKK